MFSRAGKLPRKIGPDYPLHPSVIERFKCGPVLLYDVMEDYRPLNLKGHQLTSGFYK